MLLHGQSNVSPQRGLPSLVLGTSSTVLPITSETITLYYSNSGVRTVDAGQAAGVAVTGKLSYNKILNSNSSAIGSHYDTSLVIASGVFTAEVMMNKSVMEGVDDKSFEDRLNAMTEKLTNGQFVVDYVTGTVYGKKATTGTTFSASYKVELSGGGGTASNPSVVDLQKIGGVAVISGQSAPFTVTAGLQSTQDSNLYLTTAPTATNGQGVPGLCDVNGNKLMRETYAPQSEDNINGITATQNKPLAVGTYCWLVDKSAALEASSISKASQGSYRSFSGRIDASAPSGTYFMLFINSATLPPDGAITTIVAPTKIVHTTGTDSPINIDFTMNCVNASAGLVWCLSSTEFTKTISGAYVSATALYA